MLHHWDEPAELLNFLLRRMPPDVYAVPGQHDLPNHVYGQLERSAFHTLCEAGVVTPLRPGLTTHKQPHLAISGWPWGFAPKPAVPYPGGLRIAVVHKYLWFGTAHHERASTDDCINAALDSFTGYDVVLIGDNHQQWDLRRNGQLFWNNGAAMRRRHDDPVRPRVGILYSDGTVEPHYLDTSKDKWSDKETAKAAGGLVDIPRLVAAIRQLGDKALDFHAAVEEFLKNNETEPETARLVRQCTEEAKQ